MTPAAIAQLLKDYGSTGVAALCIFALVWQSKKLDAAHEREVDALKLILPLTERVTVAVAVLEAKKKPVRGPNEITNPGVPNPILPAPVKP